MSCQLVRILLVLVFIHVATASGVFIDEPFWQDYPTRLILPSIAPISDWNELPFSDTIVQIEQFHSTVSDENLSAEFYILTKEGLWSLQEDLETLFQIQIPQNISQGKSRIVSIIPQATHAVKPNNPRFILVTPSMLYDCHIVDDTIISPQLNTTCSSVSVLFGNVNDAALNHHERKLLVAADEGLFEYNLESGLYKTISPISTGYGKEPFLTVAYYYDASSKRSIIASGIQYVVWRTLENGQWYDFQVPGIIDDTPTGLAFDHEGVLWIVNSVCVNKQFQDLTFERVSGLDGGLPSSNLTSVAVDKLGAIWIGSLYGGIRYFKGEWNYYYGPRWLPTKDFGIESNSVISTTTSDVNSGTAAFATSTGISIIRFEKWTLEQKAAYYETLIYPRHDRFGLVASTGLKQFGDLSSWFPTDTDNDGLWTGLYVAAESYRYAVTKDMDAKKRAWRGFEAMEFLNNVTGITGLMAKSVIKYDPSRGSNWHNSTKYPGWMWKDNASSDDVTGHMMTYPIVYHLIAETPEEKARVKRLMSDIINYIIDNDFYLIDITGKPTEWGNWNPTYLNDNPYWYDERGLNSVQILSWLLSVYEITGEEKIIQAFKELVTNYRYDINIINMKITQPSDDNHSDDELGFLSYLTYTFSNSSYMKKEFLKSMKRSWEINRPEKSSFLNFIYGTIAGGKEFDVENAVWCLRNWPLSQVEWPVDNMNRKDIIISPDSTRKDHQQATRVLPYDENTVLVWNANPYVLAGGDGFTEQPPSAWLLPYWLARYNQFIQ